MRASLSSCAVPVEPAALLLLADLSKVLSDWGRWYVSVPRRSSPMVCPD